MRLLPSSIWILRQSVNIALNSEYQKSRNPNDSRLFSTIVTAQRFEIENAFSRF